MNTGKLPVSAWLLAIGAGAVLLIGAFARFDPASSSHPIPAFSANPPPLTQDDPPAEAAAEPTLPADLSPGLSEIIKLVQAHVDESVILAYLKNSGQVFSPTAGEIVYLSDLGLSQDVIGLLVKTAPPAAAPQSSQETAAVAPVPAPAPSPSPAGAGEGRGEGATAALQSDTAAIQPNHDAGVGAFYDGLAAYGAWVQQPGYGLCWQPTVETIDPGWRPYVDAGQWLYSDSGWYWQSGYTWGWAVFHYGRWANVRHRGWVWVPGNVWAPAWVAWRSTSSYIGWAPLPPGVGLNVLAQLTFNGRPAGLDATLGLTPSAYTFVSTSNLTSRSLPRRVVPAPRIDALVHQSAVINGYAIVNNRIFNRGASREAVAAAAHKAVPEFALQAVSSPEAAGLAMDRKTLAVYCPPLSPAEAAPSAPLGVNKPRSQAPVEKLAHQEPVALAANDAADAVVVPGAQIGGDVSVQLPPLRYPAADSPPPVRHHSREIVAASAPDSAPAGRAWLRGYGATVVERPATPAPRLEGFNPSARPAEPPRFEGINPPARQGEPPRVPVENRPALVEPARAAPAPPASSSSSGTSKSGK